MALAYRIVSWDRVHEVAQSRRCKVLTWVPVPNKHDSIGLRRLFRLPNSLAVYGAYELMVQISSRLPPELRGWIVNPEGEPLTADDLSSSLGGTAEVWSESFDVLSKPELKICWLVMEDIEPVLGARLSVVDDAQERGEEMRGDERRGDTGVPVRAPPAAFSPERRETPKTWVDGFIEGVISNFGLPDNIADAQRRSFARVGWDIGKRPDRDALAVEFYRMADELRDTGGRPILKWQGKVNERLGKNKAAS